jgi:hypothetical protein
MQYRPLGPVITCQHLVSQRLQHRKVGWYAACELGDEVARRRSVVRLDAASL